MPASAVTLAGILGSLVLGTTASAPSDLGSLQALAVQETVSARALHRQELQTPASHTWTLLKLCLELLRDMGVGAVKVIWPVIKELLKGMLQRVLEMAVKVMHAFTKSDTPYRRLGLASLCLFIAMQTRKFVWRVRGCTEEYFITDEKACLRDSLEFTMPRRIYFWLWMKVYDQLFDPQLYGLERLQRVLRRKDEKPLSTPRGLTLPCWADDTPEEAKSADCKDDTDVDSGSNGATTTTSPAQYKSPPQSMQSHSGAIEPKGSRPIIFVGNHTMLAADMCTLQWHLGKQFHLYLRGVAHKGHFNFPGWSHGMRFLGAISGTREACKALLSDGWSQLVYPGGGREVMKKSTDDPYKLMWGTRTGFARVAIDNGALVVPVASVGCNETFPSIADIPFDWQYGKYKAEEPVDSLSRREQALLQRDLDGQSTEGKITPWQSPYHETVHQSLDDTASPAVVDSTGSQKDLRVTVPLVVPTPMHQQRWYFEIGEPIDAAQFSHAKNPDLAARFLRDRIKDSLERSIVELKKVQHNDPKRYTLSRWMQNIFSVFRSEQP